VNGFGFVHPDAQGMLDCLDQALSIYAQPVAWRKLQRFAMSCMFGWDRSAHRYIEIYNKASLPHALSSCAPADAIDSSPGLHQRNKPLTTRVPRKSTYGTAGVPEAVRKPAAAGHDRQAAEWASWPGALVNVGLLAG